MVKITPSTFRADRFKVLFLNHSPNYLCSFCSIFNSSGPDLGTWPDCFGSAIHFSGQVAPTNRNFGASQFEWPTMSRVLSCSSWRGQVHKPTNAANNWENIPCYTALPLN